MRIAVFPGSFDPFTNGHLDLVQRILPLFDTVIIAIGINSKKQYYFDLESRIAALEAIFHDEPRVFIKQYSGLTTKFCKEVGASCIVRGLRNSSDFEFENAISQFNRAVEDGIETLFISTRPEFCHISSSIVREILMNNGNAKPFVPERSHKFLS